MKRPRISVDVLPHVRRRLRLAAARRDVTVRQYVLDAIEERLREDLGDDDAETLALIRKTDPVLADLWDNVKDAAYHRSHRQADDHRSKTRFHAKAGYGRG